jgi:hypothetical protein
LQHSASINYATACPSSSSSRRRRRKRRRRRRKNSDNNNVEKGEQNCQAEQPACDGTNLLQLD